MKEWWINLNPHMSAIWAVHHIFACKFIIAIGLDIAYDVVYLSLPNMSNECLNSHERPYSFTETHSNPREAPGSDFLNTLNAGLEEV